MGDPWHCGDGQGLRFPEMWTPGLPLPHALKTTRPPPQPSPCRSHSSPGLCWRPVVSAPESLVPTGEWTFTPRPCCSPDGQTLPWFLVAPRGTGALEVFSLLQELLCLLAFSRGTSGEERGREGKQGHSQRPPCFCACPAGSLDLYQSRRLRAGPEGYA